MASGPFLNLPFLRKSEPSEPLVVSMTGTSLGQKVIFSGATPSIFLPLAVRVGLSGQFTVLTSDGPAATAAAERAGVLIDVITGPPASESYDLAVVETVGDWAADAARLRGAVRPGGRIVVVSGRPGGGFLARLRTSGASGPDAAEVVRDLTTAGWSRARAVGEQDGVRFVEAVKLEMPS